jgi:hypothetical protein
VTEDFDSIFASFSLARGLGCHPPPDRSITPVDEQRGEIPALFAAGGRAAASRRFLDKEKGRG